MTPGRSHDRASIAHLEVDRAGIVTGANEACAVTFRRLASDLIGAPLASLFSDGESGKEKIHQVLLQLGANGEEISFLSGEGSEQRWGQLFAWPIRDADGAVHELQVIVLDVTEHRRLQAELAESEARFRVLGDSAPVMLWMSGRDARCTFFNQRWLEFTGRTMDAELGEGWIEGVHPEDFQHCMDIYLEAFVSRRDFRMEYRLRRADGLYRWILDTGLPRYLPDGQYAGFIGSCIDITEFKEANEALLHLKGQLEKRVQEAREAISVRDEFLSIASHELRTPLTSLVLQLQGLQNVLHEAKGGGLDGKLSGKIDKAVKATGRLTALVDSLLDVSRIATGRLELQPEECDLVEVTRDTVEWASDAARHAGCEIRCRVEVPGALHGRWDRARLEQILENLLSNAIKYGAGRPIEVLVGGTLERAVLAVKDNGIGVSQTDLDRIFARFERAVPSSQYGGLGLGLYITRQIVEAHGGNIRVASDVGAGALFEVELPRRLRLAPDALGEERALSVTS